MTEPAVGSLLGGKYRVEGVLGRGGMGVVVAARHLELDQKVAIKCLLEEALEMADVVERFAREARAAASIRGEHVARVLDVGRLDDGIPYMVMEHLEGHDLAAELQRRGALPIADAVRYVLEACEAVAQAHAARIVHRDLKPSNLFLAETPGRRPIVKVLDFGISKVVEADAHAITSSARLMGTPYYMSPEQLLSARTVDERSDLWSLGVILYELLVGAPPFTGDVAPEIIAKIIRNEPARPRERRAEIPEGLEHVILKCLRPTPEERFADVAELAAALAAYAEAADRGSALAIARVLGKAGRPKPEGSTAAPVGLSPMAQSIVTGGVGPHPGRSPMAATAHDLSVSARGAAGPGGARWARGWAVASLAIVGGVVVGVVALQGRSAPSPAPSQGAAVVAFTAAESGSFVPSPPSSDVLAASAATSPAPAARAPVVAGSPVAVTPRPKSSAVASASVAVPAGPARPPRNPLDIQLK